MSKTRQTVVECQRLLNWIRGELCEAVADGNATAFRKQQLREELLSYLAQLNVVVEKLERLAKPAP